MVNDTGGAALTVVSIGHMVLEGNIKWRLVMSASEMVQVSKADRDKWLARDLKSQMSGRRAAIKTAILADKARKAGITVSKEEIDNKIAEQDAKKVTEAAPVSAAALATEAEVAPASKADPVVVDEPEEEADAA